MVVIYSVDLMIDTTPPPRVLDESDNFVLVRLRFFTKVTNKQELKNIERQYYNSSAYY